MAWYERGYNQSGSGGGGGSWGGGGGWSGAGGAGFLDRLRQILHFSFPIGTYLDIHVRVNIWFLILGVYLFLLGPMVGMQLIVILFLSVLLHEFGHCLGCRAVGGHADNILMWPLGGLAFTSPPRRVWPEFVTVAAGPLVTLVLMILGFALWQGAVASYGLEVALIGNPYDAPLGQSPMRTLATVGAFIFSINLVLLLFNLLLVFYPFDGGRLVQIALWALTDYYTSMIWAVRMGLVGAVLVSIFGLFSGSLFLILIGVFGFITCYQQGQALKAEGAHEPWRKSLDMGGPSEGLISRWRHRREEKKAEKAAVQHANLEKEVDRILAKVGEHGLHSLTSKEKKILQQATDDKKRR